jgi:hypothetical protein
MAIQTFTSGQILTAAQMNSVQQQAVMTFTNEAARDAALTAPSEGMVAYLTAATVPAATGTTTTIPTGVITAYNGTNWVCLSTISAITGTGGSTTSTSYTTTLSGSPGTNPSITLVTGTTCRLDLTCIFASSDGAAGNAAYYGVAVSGATTITAANTDTANGLLRTFQVFSPTNSMTKIITGLTPGTNTFTINYKVDAGTGTYSRMFIAATGLL